MQNFVLAHRGQIPGTLSGFDRLRFRGTISLLMSVGGLMAVLSRLSVRLKDFAEFAEQLTLQLRGNLEARAVQLGRQVEYLPSLQRKEQLVEGIRATESPRRSGFIAAFSTLENCTSYDIFRNKQTHQINLRRRPRKCLHYYFYFNDPTFGLCHVRLQTWLPFDVRIVINGREWLARQMDRAGLGYLRRDNCFSWVEDFSKAEELADRQPRINWPASLDRLLAFASPGQTTLLADSPPYYWTIEQSEWATDVAFDSPQSLAAIYPTLVRQGMTNFHCSDVLRFLGKKVPAHGGVHGRYQGEVVTDLKTRPEGTRLKHRAGRNTLKMYDKQGVVLRVETTINEVRGLKVFRRKDESDPSSEREWLPLRKGVADMTRRAELSHAANVRYLDRLAAIECGTSLGELTNRLCQPVVDDAGRRHRALNPLSPTDAPLLDALLRGEFLITGFRNRDLRVALFGAAEDKDDVRRQSGQISRKLALLCAHGLIRKIEGTHRYLVTKSGSRAIAAIQNARAANLTQLTPQTDSQPENHRRQTTNRGLTV